MSGRKKMRKKQSFALYYHVSGPMARRNVMAFYRPSDDGKRKRVVDGYAFVFAGYVLIP